MELLLGNVVPSDGAWTQFQRKNAETWWKEWDDDDKVSLLNGQFFNTDNTDKSPLAFSVKKDGMVHTGYGDATEFTGKKMLLRIGEDEFIAEPYADDAARLFEIPEENAIVGLKETASKQPGSRIGRTFIGVNADGEALVLTSSLATQRFATRILTAFGAKRQQILMLDGGHSSQLMLEGRLVIPHNERGRKAGQRPVPQVIGITDNGE